MSFDVIRSAVELGLIYGLMALGIFLTYRILNIADLTVDGSFTTGAAVSAMLTSVGMPWLGIIGAIAAGMIAGVCTGLLQTKLKINPILAGILTMTALYSINLHIMGSKPNVPLLRVDTIFTPFTNIFGKELGRFLMILLITVIILVFIILFLKTSIGLAIRATGDNENMVRSSSINSDGTKIITIAMANGIVALAGALAAQYQMFADVGMGIGMVVIGLASLIIGEVIFFGKISVTYNAITVILGAIVYRIIIALTLETSMSPSDLKLISALIVIVALSYPPIKEKIQTLMKKSHKKEDIKNA